jgi:Domain of Unknown Function with PDB structure (DUF3857)/Transglutaminase-like superfamily
MSAFAWVRVIFALGIITATLRSSAQKLQDPTKEELQMTSDSKAPGASAVFLDREQTVDNENFITTEHGRIKILTDEGKQWATIEFPYDPRYHDTPVLQGRTIHADGTIIPLSGSPATLITFRDRRDLIDRDYPRQVAVFAVPDAQVGSIVEYSWSLRLVGNKPRYYSLISLPRWNVQQELFIHKEHFHYSPYTNRQQLNGAPRVFASKYGVQAKYFLFAARLPDGAHVQESPGYDYTLDLTDVPGLPREPYSPAAYGRAYRVQFYYSPYFTAPDLWSVGIKWWTTRVADLAAETKTIKDTATQITAGGDSSDAKARKIYDAVQALDNTDFARPAPGASILDQPAVGSNAKTAEQTWKDKSGTGTDLAILYLALARAAGLEAYAMKVTDRRRGAFDPNYLDIYQFDAIIVRLRTDGKDVYLDPGEKLCAYGQLHWSHALTGAIEENGKEPTITPPNNLKDAITAHTADLTVNPQGNLTGTVKILMNGPSALRWRQLNLTAGEDEVRKQLAASLPTLLPAGVTGSIGEIQSLDTSAGFLAVTIKVAGKLGLPNGKRLVLPAFFFSPGAESPFSAEHRTTAVDMRYAEQEIDKTTYHLPTDMSVVNAPQPTQLPWPDHAALVVKTEPGKGTFEIKHIFARAFVLLDPKEYGALRDYYQKLAANDQQQLVLAPASDSAKNQILPQPR